MGGRIGAVGAGVSGSTFCFEVPLPIAETETASAQDNVDGRPDRPFRVLLAEDNPANRTLIAALLSALDVSLDMVENGEEAVRAAARVPYDLILMDMQMPVMDGPTATRAIRRSPGPERHTPVVALTANVLPEQIEQCLAAGIKGHLAKPIDPRALMAALTEHTRPA